MNKTTKEDIYNWMEEFIVENIFQEGEDPDKYYSEIEEESAGVWSLMNDNIHHSIFLDWEAPEDVTLSFRSYQAWNMDTEIENYRKTSLDYLGYVKDILGDDVVPPLSKPWKQAWGYMKGLFVKNEIRLEDVRNKKKPNW